MIEAVRAIGRANGLKHRVFEAIYYHKKRTKTVAEIASFTGLSRMQVLQAGGALRKAGIVRQERVQGDTAYVQIESFQHLKPKINKLVSSPAKIKDVPTKRDSHVVKTITFTKPSTNKKRGTKRRSNQPKHAIEKVRIALLVTNPDINAPLQTAIEARDIQKAIENSPNSSSFAVKVVLAPTFDDLIDSLNRLNPQILHFSGHGGGKSIILDNDRAGQDGGEVLDYGMASRLLQATDAKISLIVLAACDTATGVEQLLSERRAIIAMSDSIDDEAACAFSARFYKSIADGVTVEKALIQAKLYLEQKGYRDSDLPTLFAKDDHAKARRFT
ncbi:CHAT domain-containing protein [Altererythrobacter sp. N1]|nr:CHAT domain-containing protein [Altererythrobacter sp. N1]